MVTTDNEKRYAVAPGPPTVETTAVYGNREEALGDMTRSNLDDDAKSDCVPLKMRTRCLNIGTWNVRSLNQDGKIENLIKEAKSLNTDILGLAETRLIGEDKITHEGYNLIYSGGSKHEHGVGILLSKAVSKSVMGYWGISQRNILVKLSGLPFNISILQTYAPTQDSTDEEIEEYYEEVENTLKVVKSDEVLIVMGDFNAKIGKERFEHLVGPHGLGQRNDRGDRLLQFCEKKDLCIANTLFQQPARRTYTWKSPGDIRRNQIDYILVSHRFKNSIVRCRTHPGADIGSDHNPVIAKIRLKLKRMQKKCERPPNVDLVKLKMEEIQSKYTVEVTNKYCILENEQQQNQTVEEDIEAEFSRLKESILHGNATAPTLQQSRKKPWIGEDILSIMDERKAVKGKDEAKYAYLNNKIKKKCRIAKENFLNTKCEEIEELNKKNKTKNLHQEVKILIGKARSSKTRGNIRDRSGTLLFEKEKILNRWEEYIGELFEDQRPEQPPYNNLNGASILKEETESAIRNTSEGKARGEDGITTEMYKALGDFAVEKLTLLFNKIYASGYIPEEMSKSIFITLPKKPKAVECGDYRLISLMPHVTKIFLRVILNRIKSRINLEVGDEQFGFRAGSGTREGIFCFNILAQNILK